VRARKRHLLVDTDGLVLKKAKVHSAKVPDQDRIKLLLKGVRDCLPRLSHLWVDAGYQGRGKDWTENVAGLERRGRTSYTETNAGEGGEDLG
jgi:putative transposase